MSKNNNIEIIIPVRNEALNLPHTLASVTEWADRVWVIDSESTDETCAIAKEAWADVVVQPWLGYAKQKNWAIDNLEINADWVFFLDADEAILPKLRDELLAIASKPMPPLKAVEP